MGMPSLLTLLFFFSVLESVINLLEPSAFLPAHTGLLHNGLTCTNTLASLVKFKIS